MDVRFKPMTSGQRLARMGWGRRGDGHSPATQASGQRPAAPRSRRQGGASQDQALYSCSCGYVFDAAVSTTVDCPHCGGPQAW